uniref:Interleukin-11b n=1 Tax=Takifugu rubripes TaxID=31033 RepID=Q494Q8_TAKRU|nr:TPA: interleukin-11b [Takifugu rubripes]
MDVIEDSAPCLLHLFLLAELIVHSASRPASSPAPCRTFRSIFHQVDLLMGLSRKLHDLSDEDVLMFESMENRLDTLPHLPHSAEYFRSFKVNESLSQLSLHTQSFRQHIDWLKLARENVSLPSRAAEDSSTHLLKLSNLLNASLHQMNEEVPQLPPLSLPIASTSFDVLQFSVEISDRLKIFCHWSKRVLRYLQRLNRCPKH